VLNPVWAWLFHGERPGAWALVGGAVILGATTVRMVLEARRGGSETSLQAETPRVPAG
jgi:DME family drug/metabolite transporter